MKDEVIANCRDAMESLFGTVELEAERDRLDSECRALTVTAQAMVAENARTAIDQDYYQNRYDSLSKRFEEAKAKLDAVTEEIRKLKNSRADMEAFMKEFEGTESFSMDCWNRLADHATVYSISDIRVTFKNGQEVKG